MTEIFRQKDNKHIEKNKTKNYQQLTDRVKQTR